MPKTPHSSRGPSRSSNTTRVRLAMESAAPGGRPSSQPLQSALTAEDRDGPLPPAAGGTAVSVVRTLIVTALALGALATPASAGIWTEIPSGTASEITAIEYQSDTRFWFTTANGEIWKRKPDLSGFEKVYGPSAIPFNDIEFQSGGDVGFAVGDGGVVLRSQTAGSLGSWVDVNPPATRIPASNEGDGSGNKCTINTPLGDGQSRHRGECRPMEGRQPEARARAGEQLLHPVRRRLRRHVHHGQPGRVLHRLGRRRHRLVLEQQPDRHRAGEAGGSLERLQPRRHAGRR